MLHRELLYQITRLLALPLSLLDVEIDFTLDLVRQVPDSCVVRVVRIRLARPIVPQVRLRTRVDVAKLTDPAHLLLLEVLIVLRPWHELTCDADDVRLVLLDAI